MIYLVIITAITVSLDSFFCGLSLSIGNKKKLPLVLIVTLTVFCMCVITNYASYLFLRFLNERTACLGGLILIGIGIYNLLKKESNDKLCINKNFIFQCFCAGFAVGLDGAVANLSLAIMGMNQFYVPIIIGITHGIMIGLSTALSQTKIFKKLDKIKIIAPIILICLGIYKLLGLFL